MARITCILTLLLAAQVQAQDGWLLFRGNPQRTGADAGAKPWDKPQSWRRELLLDKYPLGDKQFQVDPDEGAKKLIDDLRKNADPAILPGSFPLIVDGMAIYRSYRDVRAVALRTVDVKDEKGVVIESIKAGDIVWKSVPHDASLSVLLEREPTRSALLRLVALQPKNQFLWANATIGVLNSDGKSVFVVSDCAFPDTEVNPKGLPPPDLKQAVMHLKPFLTQNSLIAYDVSTGKITWETFANGKHVLPDSLFLGAPLPYEGKLYALNEAKTSLRLVRIDANVKKWKVPTWPDIDKTLVLTEVTPGEQAIRHPMRRSQSLQIAVAGDLLLCPTNAGVLIGVDRAKMTERWRYNYRKANPAGPPTPVWQAAGPIVTKDRIIFTAADVPDIHCIDFKGQEKWTAASDKGKDAYVATVHDDIVLVVGKTHCRGLRLADGSEKWKLATGMPAGVGVKVGGVYYLPLQPNGRWAIDIAKGTKIDAVESLDVQGNLAAHRGMFLSQAPTHITAFKASPAAK